MTQREHDLSVEPTLHELDARLNAIEKKLARPDYFSRVSVTVATLIALTSLAFTAINYFQDRPRLTVAFDDKPTFFHPKDLTDPKSPDWFFLTCTLANNGRQPASIIRVGFNAVLGKDRIPGFRIDKIMSGKEDPEVPFNISGGDSKRVGFSYGMSGLGRAKEFDMRWRNLPAIVEFEFFVQDSSGKTFTQTFHLQDAEKIDLETAREYESSPEHKK